MPNGHSFLVHHAPADTGTHVLAIGVGSYPCLLDGDPARLLANHQNLGQLGAPPRSARAVADWFIGNFNNPARPLASVALLVSGPGSSPGERATFANVERAIQEWKARCETNEGNLPVFYFCGHGLAEGALLSLLVEDFGADQGNPLNGAIDFNRLHQGMKTCGARQQVFFVDACRTDASMMRYAAGYAGRVVLQPMGGAGYFENPI